MERYQEVALTETEQQHVTEHGSPINRGEHEVALLAQDDNSETWGYLSRRGDLAVFDGGSYQGATDWMARICDALSLYGGWIVSNTWVPGYVIGLPSSNQARASLVAALRRIDAACRTQYHVANA